MRTVVVGKQAFAIAEPAKLVFGNPTTMQPQDNIVLYNTRIFEEENMSPPEFMEKVKRVKRIRTSRKLCFTFFPEGAKDMQRNRALWEFVNGNLNALNDEDHKIFITMFPRWMYLFLRYSTWENVMSCITVALTGLYAAEPAQRAMIEAKLDRSLLLQVKDNFAEHFQEFEDFSFIVAQDWQLADDINDDYFDKRKRFISTFDYFFRDQCSNPLILPFIYPIFDTRYPHKSLFNLSRFHIALVHSFFSKSDWRRIVQGNSWDELIRAESEEEPWINWKMNYIKAHRF